MKNVVLGDDETVVGVMVRTFNGGHASSTRHNQSGVFASFVDAKIS